MAYSKIFLKGKKNSEHKKESYYAEVPSRRNFQEDFAEKSQLAAHPLLCKNYCWEEAPIPSNLGGKNSRPKSQKEKNDLQWGGKESADRGIAYREPNIDFRHNFGNAFQFQIWTKLKKEKIFEKKLSTNESHFFSPKEKRPFFLKKKFQRTFAICMKDSCCVMFSTSIIFADGKNCPLSVVVIKIFPWDGIPEEIWGWQCVRKNLIPFDGQLKGNDGSSRRNRFLFKLYLWRTPWSILPFALSLHRTQTRIFDGKRSFG